LCSRGACAEFPEDEPNGTNTKLVSVVQRRRGREALAAKEGAVLASQIFDRGAARANNDSRVVARNLEDVEPQAQPTVLFGLRPCEARAFHALDVVFNWDSKDKFFNTRMANTTVVGLSCTQADDACFCTSLGSRPDDPQGSDILLSPLKGGGFVAEVLTEKGKALEELAKVAFSPPPIQPDLIPPATVAPAFDAKALQEKLAAKFDSPLWAEQSLRCLGCGACAFVCPTCVCFDIQDEADTKQGQRLRAWDSCGMRIFTLHASGHNPRDKQSQRWRQRVYHKFAYYPERLGTLGCVGCGKCSRACPVDMNLKQHLAQAATQG